MSGSARNSPKDLLDLITTVRESFCVDKFVIFVKKAAQLKAKPSSIDIFPF